jgi:hypothetical protein
MPHRMRQDLLSPSDPICGYRPRDIPLKKFESQLLLVAWKKSVVRTEVAGATRARGTDVTWHQTWPYVIVRSNGRRGIARSCRTLVITAPAPSTLSEVWRVLRVNLWRERGSTSGITQCFRLKIPDFTPTLYSSNFVSYGPTIASTVGGL